MKRIIPKFRRKMNYHFHRLVKGHARCGIFQNLAHPSEKIGYVEIHFAGYLFGISWKRWGP